MTKKPGTAYIAEVSDFHHQPSWEVVATGLFRAVHEPYDELLKEVPLSEALAWARARTPRVWLSVMGEGLYSAGSRRVGLEADQPPEWDDSREVVRRRVR